MRKRIIVAVAIFSIFIFCQQQEQAFDLQKIDTRQQLDDVLKEIDEQIEILKMDTLQIEDSGLKEQLMNSERELAEMRDVVLEQLAAINDVGPKSWDQFSAAIDSLEGEVTKSIEQAREHLNTMTQRTPPVPPVY